jgi:hypothetical protein
MLKEVVLHTQLPRWQNEGHERGKIQQADARASLSESDPYLSISSVSENLDRHDRQVRLRDGWTEMVGPGKLNGVHDL